MEKKLSSYTVYQEGSTNLNMLAETAAKQPKTPSTPMVPSSPTRRGTRIRRRVRPYPCPTTPVRQSDRKASPDLPRRVLRSRTGVAADKCDSSANNRCRPLTHDLRDRPKKKGSSTGPQHKGAQDKKDQRNRKKEASKAIRSKEKERLELLLMGILQLRIEKKVKKGEVSTEKPPLKLAFALASTSLS